jgi:transcriptional regulator with XRE-family HTH domain
MKAAELLDLAKGRLSLKSDYALAKMSGIPKQRISQIRSGKEAMPLHLIYWLAVTLEKDPAELVAQQEIEREKNPERVKFWNSFLSRAALLLGLVVALPSMLSGSIGNAQAASGGIVAASHNPYYVKSY